MELRNYLWPSRAFNHKLLFYSAHFNHFIFPPIILFLFFTPTPLSLPLSLSLPLLSVPLSLPLLSAPLSLPLSVWFSRHPTGPPSFLHDPTPVAGSNSRASCRL